MSCICSSTNAAVSYIPVAMIAVAPGILVQVFLVLLVCWVELGGLGDVGSHRAAAVAAHLVLGNQCLQLVLHLLRDLHLSCRYTRTTKLQTS